MLSFPETTIKTEQPHNREPENSNGSGTSELRSGAIFADERGEAYNLLPLEEPVNLGLKCAGNCLAQRISGFPASVYDPAEIGLVNANHLGKPVLPYPCFVDRQLQVWVNRSLVEFHFLLASLVSPVHNGGWGDPKSTTTQKNLPSMYWYPFSHRTLAKVIHDMFFITNRVLMSILAGSPDHFSSRPLCVSYQTGRKKLREPKIAVAQL
jgi:hypothetical protein